MLEAAEAASFTLPPSPLPGLQPRSSAGRWELSEEEGGGGAAAARVSGPSASPGVGACPVGARGAR